MSEMLSRTLDSRGAAYSIEVSPWDGLGAMLVSAKFSNGHSPVSTPVVPAMLNVASLRSVPVFALGSRAMTDRKSVV